MSKTRMGKRVASLLLSLVMMLSLLPTTVYATGGTGETNGANVEATNTFDEGGTTSDPEATSEDEGGGANVSEGETATVATIGSATYETLDAAIAAVADGETIVVNAGEYKLNGSLSYAGKAFTIEAAEGAKVSFDMSAAVALHGAKITFNNVTFDYKTNGNYIGLQHADTLVYNDCTINGMVFLYAVNETFNSCTFEQTSAGAYNVWTYGAQNVAFNGCTFNCVGRCVLVYNEGAIDKTDLTVENTKFNASAPAEGKAAIEIDTSLMAGGATITVDDKTTDTGFAAGSNSGKTLWNDKKQTADTNKNTTVTVAGEKVFEPKATVVKHVSVNGTSYETLEDAIDAATPDANGVITYEISGKVDVTATGWVQVAKAGLTGLTAVKFVGTTDDAAIYVTKEDAVLADQVYGNVDVSFSGLTLVKENPTYLNDYAEFTQYFAMEIRATVKTGVVTYTDCKFPEGVINNTYGKTVFTGCEFSNDDSRYNLWVKEGEVELNNGAFTGTRGVKLYNTGNAKATITIKDTTFVGLTGKAAIVVSQPAPADVTLENVTARNCTVGLIQKDTATDATIIKANGESISGTFNITNAGNAKNEFNISAGTFTSEVSNDYCADGFKVKANDNGTYGVVEAATAVAKIGDASYETLQAAIDAAAAGETVKLLANVDENVEIAKEKNLTLDLNGCILNGGTGTAKAALTNYGTITIKDSSASKAGTIKRDDKGTTGETSYYVIRNRGTMTIESGTVINNSGYKQASSIGSMNGSSLICNGDCDEGGTLTINGGTFTQNNFIAIKNGALGVLHVTGGTITSGHSAIQNWYKADITGGEIKGQLWTDAYIKGESVGETTIGGNAKFTGEIVMDIYGSVAPTLAITGGNLSVTNWRITNAAANAGAKPAVSGGTFTSAVPEAYCAEGFIPTANADGTYGVKAGAYVAQIGDVKYESLQAAIDAAKRNATVKMLADTRENVTIDKALTLDLNGFTLNGGTEKGKPALTITARTVTIKDSSEAQTGTIMREDTAENSGVSSHYVIDIQGNAWVMFESGNVKNGSGAGGTKGASLVRVGNDSVAKYPGLNIKGGTFTQDNFIVIKVDRGDLFLNGGTLNSANNTYAVENWFRATIKGGTVNGAVSSWTYSSGSNSTLEISGGTVNGAVTSVNYGDADKVAKVEITGGTVNGELDTRSYDPKTGELTSIDDAAKATIKVTGGTFKENPTKYVVEGSTVKTNTDGTFGVEKAYLARIGETSYYTMDEAFKAQTTSGEPIVMLRDYTTGGTFNSGSIDRTVDLNGHTWTYTGTDTNDAAFEINHPNVTLTVKNGTVVSNSMVGLIPSAMGGTIKYDNAGLLFEDVTMTANGHSGIETNGNNTNDAVTLKDSTLNVPDGFGIYFPSSGTLTIDNSTITAKTMGVQVCAGSLNITGEKTAIDVTGGPVDKTENDGAIQDGAAISIVNRTGYKELENVTVTGGKFTAKTGNEAIKAYNWANKTASEFTAAEKVAVSGGTFSSAVPEGLCATGFIPTTNGDGTYGVKEGVYVAKVDNVKYETLQEAIDAASQKNGGQTEVKLLCDLTITETIVFAKQYSDGSVLLNLGGYTLTGNDCRALQINKGNLYLENGTVTSIGDNIVNSSSVIRIGSNKAEYSGISPMLYMRNGAKVLAPKTYGVTLFGSATVSEQLTVAGNASIVATGDSPAISGNGDKKYNKEKGTEIVITGNAVVSAENNYAIYHPDNGTLKIQGNASVSGKGGIQMCSGTLEISYGSPTINALGKANHETGAAGPIYDIAAISVVNRSYPGGAPVVTIKDTPTITANEGEVIHAYTWSSNAESEWADAGDNINVSGGTYNKTFNEDYLAADCTLVSSDGMYTVEQKKVAEVNGVAYATLSEAIAAANAGDTVKLLRDINTPEISYMISKSLTIDLNGMTVTGSGYDAVFQIDNADAKVVIKNGKVVAVEQSGSAGKYTMAIWASKAGCEVTLEGLDVSQKITHTDDPQMDMIYASGGTITINSGNFVSGTPAWTLNCYDTSYEKGIANIIVKGGTFVGFDPANNKAEGENTNFVAAGYVSNMNEDGSYTVVPENAKITVGKRLSIGNDLTITYLVNLTDCTNPWVKFQLYNDDIKGYTTVEVKNYGTDTVTGPDGKPMDVLTFDFTGINPQRMTDTLKATVYATDASGNVVEYQVDDYSVAQYCSNKLAKLGQNDPLRKLIGNLVAYGAAAQVYQNYRTDNLVSTVVSGAVSTDYTDRLSSVTQYTGKVLGTAGVNIKGKTLVLSNTFAVRVYFTVNEGIDITNVSFNVTANGKTDTVNSFEKDEKLGYYYFDYANLNATQLDSEVKFESFVNGTGVGDMVTYSVNTYLAKKMPNYDKSSNAYKFMAELFNYGCACTEYASK